MFSFFQYVCSFSHVDIIGIYNPGSQEDSGLPNLGLGRATFFMVRAGFRACSFGTGRARVTVNLDGLISGRNISNSGHFRATFGPHLGHI